MTKTRSAQTAGKAELDIVGSSTFGRFPKVSIETTFNMFTADKFSINFAGYKFRTSLLANGRGLFSSKKGNLMFAASERSIFKMSPDLSPLNIRDLETDSGDVFIDEDILSNVAFCDGANIYIYNYATGLTYIAGTDVDASTKAITPLDFTPNNICFHNGRFISTSSHSGGNQIGQWRLSTTKVTDDGTVYVIFPASAQFQGAFQTKPDLPVAVARFPGRENQILIMGSILTEVWSDQGLAKFPYQRNSSFNIDFGCLNPATIATLNNLVVWLGSNERAGPVIMYSTGQDIQQISTDGIDAKFETLNFPERSYGFTYRQAGHLFYFITFYDPSDNLTLTYDFNEGKFYNLTNENLDFHIAKHTVFFNNKYYFISITDGDIYEINSMFTTFEYRDEVVYEIPRMRMCKTIPAPNGVPGVMNDLYFTVEQGIDPQNTGQGNNISSIAVTASGSDYTTCTALIEGDGKGAHATVTIVDGEVTAVTVDDAGVGYSWAVVTLIGDGTEAFCTPTLNVNSYVPRVDISISYDGGYTWSRFDQMQLNTYGNYKNRFYYNGLGYGNEFTLQFRYWCKSRFVCTNGEVSFYE